MPYQHLLFLLFTKVYQLYRSHLQTTLVADFKFYNLSYDKVPIITQAAFYTLGGDMIVSTIISYTDEHSYPISLLKAAQLASPFYKRYSGLPLSIDIRRL